MRPTLHRHRRKRGGRCIAIVLTLLVGSIAAATDVAGLDDARDLYERGKLTEAQVAFQRLAAADAKNAEVNFHLGEIALQHNEPERAVAFFQQSIAATPGVSRYHHRLGDAYGRSAQKASIFTALGLAKKCLAAYQRAVVIDPENLDARYSLFLFYRNAPGIIGGGAEKAAAEAGAIKARDPARGRVAFATLHASQKNYDAAHAELAAIKPIELSDVRSDRVFLSDVVWASAKVGWARPARNHAWVDETGREPAVLLVHGRLYAKGLYAHSPSRYSFALGGKWNVFTATVGLREGAHQQGSAIFTLRGDGRQLFRSAMLRSDSSQRLKVDIAGVNELELIAEPGEGHNHSSWAIWAEPVVRR